MMLLTAAELAVEETEASSFGDLDLAESTYSPEEVELLRAYAWALDARVKHSIRMRKLIERVVREEAR